MNRTNAFPIFLYFFFFVSPLVWSSPNKTISPQERINSVLSVMDKHQISQIELLYINKDLESAYGFSPDLLERSYSYKIIMQVPTRVIWDIRKELADLVIMPAEDSGDLRLGIIFYGLEKKRILGIYFNGTGEKGSVDEIPVKFQGKFFSWLVNTYLTNFK